MKPHEGKANTLSIDIGKFKSILLEPKRIVAPYAWVEHIPFAFFLIEILRPGLLVELGVHSGNSYNAFCQAVSALQIDTKCCGVDTWKGDEQAFFYDESVFKDLEAYQREGYGDFSSLLRMTFDEALGHFSDGTIDLLHIDGLHTYDAVKHDFESWLPKMSEKGVMLLHDTQVHDRDFGVWRLWEEISGSYPSFEFRHGYGLGVAAIGKSVSQGFLDCVTAFNRSPFYEGIFSMLGRELSARRERDDLASEPGLATEDAAGLRAQLFDRASKVARLTAEVEGLRAQLSDRDRETLRLAGEVEGLRAQLDDQGGEIARLKGDIEVITGTKAWRLAQKARIPLRLFLEAYRSATAPKPPDQVSVPVVEDDRTISEDTVPPYLSEYQPNEDFSGHETDLKAIAFYLPQYHRIPENDAWWGEGFTEWHNTRKTTPRFRGQYQPREPHPDFGYYDLSDVNVIKKQARLAREHGIHGFCFHYYWFSGRRLLEKPLDLLLEHKEIDINYCVSWANHNWTRAWDGLDESVLMRQEYDEGGDIALISDLSRYLTDPRYIKADGRPVILIFKLYDLPEPKETIERWRQWCRDNGLGEICVVSVRTSYREAFERDVRGIADREVELPPQLIGPTTPVYDRLPLGRNRYAEPVQTTRVWSTRLWRATPLPTAPTNRSFGRRCSDGTIPPGVKTASPSGMAIRSNTTIDG